jgi:hypothetical protein
LKKHSLCGFFNSSWKNRIETLTKTAADYYRKKHYDQCVMVYNEALQLLLQEEANGKNNVELLHNLAMVHFNLGSAMSFIGKTKAKDYLEEAVKRAGALQLSSREKWRARLKQVVENLDQNKTMLITEPRP